MKYICDAPDKKTWFRLETEAEADRESELMDHAVAKHYRRERETAMGGFKPASTVNFEQNIGMEAHIQRSMPLFLTLRNPDGDALVTAMLPPDPPDSASKTLIVGPGNRDPYPDHQTSIDALGAHFKITLDRARCFPYGRQ
jgi:hypothetical protein